MLIRERDKNFFAFFLHRISTCYKSFNVFMEIPTSWIFSQGSGLISQSAKEFWASHLPPGAPRFFLGAGAGPCNLGGERALNLCWGPGGTADYFCIGALKRQTSAFVSWRSSLRIEEARLQPRSKDFCKCKLWGPQRISSIS